MRLLRCFLFNGIPGSDSQSDPSDTLIPEKIEHQLFLVAVSLSRTGKVAFLNDRASLIDDAKIYDIS